MSRRARTHGLALSLLHSVITNGTISSQEKHPPRNCRNPKKSGSSLGSARKRVDVHRGQGGAAVKHKPKRAAAGRTRMEYRTPSGSTFSFPTLLILNSCIVLPAVGQRGSHHGTTLRFMLLQCNRCTDTHMTSGSCPGTLGFHKRALTRGLPLRHRDFLICQSKLGPASSSGFLLKK